MRAHATAPGGRSAKALRARRASRGFARGGAPASAVTDTPQPTEPPAVRPSLVARASSCACERRHTRAFINGFLRDLRHPLGVEIFVRYRSHTSAAKHHHRAVRRGVARRARAATTAVPAEPPTRSPSSRTSRWVIAKLSRSVTTSARSASVRSHTAGITLDPMPSTRYEPGSPRTPRSTKPARRLPAGSARTTLTRGFLALRKRPTPVRVPPVPTPATKAAR